MDGGYAVDSSAVDHYIGEIVNPALDEFTAIAQALLRTTGSSFSTMLGQAKLPGSTEFTGTCTEFLTTFFELHHTLADQQQDLVNALTAFRDNLRKSAAAYVRQDAGSALTSPGLSAQLETRLSSDGATR
jgi:hypothetical protein